MDFTQDDIDSLAAKLAAADLTVGEQAALDALVDAAAGEVAGFGMGFDFAPLRPGIPQVRKDSGEAHLDDQQFSASGTGNLRKDITVE